MGKGEIWARGNKEEFMFLYKSFCCKPRPRMFPGVRNFGFSLNDCDGGIFSCEFVMIDDFPVGLAHGPGEGTLQEGARA